MARLRFRFTQLARFLLRPWSKKRGNTNQNEGLFSTVGEVAFFAMLFLIGVFGLSLVLVNRFAPPVVARMPANAISPEIDTTLSTSLSSWVAGTFSVVAIATGAASLIYRLTHFGASSEYRSVLASRAGKLEKDAIELIGPATGVLPNPEDQIGRLPNVPQGRFLTDSPGERLAYRLAPEAPSGSIAGPTTLALLWNAVWFVLLATAVSGFWHGNPRWILTLLLIPFAVIGYWSFKFFLTQLRQSAGVGPTIVEIDQHPLYPGGECQLFVQQVGRIKLKRLSVHLTCEEESFYRQGTDVRVDKHESFVQVLCKERDVRVDPRRPWEQQLVLALPAQVMHSFVGTNNAIRWKIVVLGESRPWPSFCRSFPVVVYPPGLPPKRSPR